MSKFAANLFIMISVLTTVTPARAETKESMMIFEISNREDNSARILCILFNSANGFPKDDKKASGEFIINPGEPQSCQFTGFPQGQYALSVLEDQDNNNEMTTNLVGMPREPWAVSNNAKPGTFSAPQFSAAAFEFDGGEFKQKIYLRWP